MYRNYSNNISKNANHGFIERPQDSSEQYFKFNDERESHIYKVGVDVYINDKNTLSLFTSQNPAENGTNGATRTVFYKNNNASNDYQDFDAQAANNSAQYNLNFK